MSLHEGSSGQPHYDPDTISLMGGMGMGSVLRRTVNSPVIVHEQDPNVDTDLRMSKKGAALVVTTATMHDLSPDSHVVGTSDQS